MSHDREPRLTGPQRGHLVALGPAGVGLVIVMWSSSRHLERHPVAAEHLDMTMPHVWTMFAAMGEPEVRGSETTVLDAVISATFRSLLLAFGGFLIGVAVGLLLAVIMQRFLFAERGLLPSLSLPQTVPCTALAPSSSASATRSRSDRSSGRPPTGDVHRRVLGVFPAIGGSVARSPGTDTDVTGTHALLRGYAQSNRAKLRFRRPFLHRSGTEGLGRGLRCRHGGRRDLYRRSRGHRSLTDRVRAPDHLQPAKVYVAVFGAIALGLVVAALVTALTFT